MEQDRTPDQGVLASDKDHVPVANHAIRRQSPEVGASCLNGHAAIRVEGHRVTEVPAVTG